MIHAFYKPKGISSYDVIRKLKKQYPGQKIGHGGTLDPLAEGVLVIGIGREGTRKLQDVLKGTDKVYEATIELGTTSETDDAEGPFIQTLSPQLPNLPTLQSVLSTFEGEITQVPPRYSAIKLGGVPAYKRARRGETFQIQPKQVLIKRIELLEYSFPLLFIRVTSGSGVYIRSLARDIGEKLGTGAYLKHLKRTAVGSFTIDQATRLK